MGWVIRRAEPNCWTVGYYDGEGLWYPVFDFESPLQAACHCSWLNGGDMPPDDIACDDMRRYGAG
jgi:hypothetical protein